MHISENGRIVHFVFIDQSGNHAVPMKLWCINLSEDRYLIRPSPGHEGWVVGMARTETGLEIARNEETFPQKHFKLYSAADEDLPSWFAERLDQALSAMTEVERAKCRRKEGRDDEPNPCRDG